MPLKTILIKSLQKNFLYRYYKYSIRPHFKLVKTLTGQLKIIYTANFCRINKPTAPNNPSRPTVAGSGITNLLVGDYAGSSTIMKIIKLPIAILVQYLNPINIFYFDHVIPWEYIDINLKFIWLLFLGPLLIFCLINYNGFSSTIKSLFFIALFGYSLIAFLNGGLVPRYALCFMVISVIPMGFIYKQIQTNRKYRLRFKRFFSIYIMTALLASSIYLFI